MLVILTHTDVSYFMMNQEPSSSVSPKIKSNEIQIQIVDYETFIYSKIVRYLMLKARSLLYDFPERELEALKSGFDKVFPRKYKNLLSARELGELIGGETKLDWQDWMSNTTHHVPQVLTLFWV